MTEDLLCGLQDHVGTVLRTRNFQVKGSPLRFSAPFRRLDFIPAVENALQQPLPNLQDGDARIKVAQLLHEKGINLPDHDSLPALLDRLSSTLLEPQCEQPTFIVNHPECMSPLSKSYVHPSVGQRVAARAELFVNSQEIANTYEEENSPFEQRRKFMDQLEHQGREEDASIDENYLEALEWGLPPTGGWGCGIDRICMMFSGASRIGDVLTFGSLKNVTALGRGQRTWR
jgi:lysyl-tRNA synthetase, class II